MYASYTPPTFAFGAQARITAFNPEDFAFDLGGPDPDNLIEGIQLRTVNVNQLPALEGLGISMTLVNLDPCAINLPHVHPRATEVSPQLLEHFCFLSKSAILSAR